MSSATTGGEHATHNPSAGKVDMKLEVVLLGVSDVDRAQAFYAKLGSRLDLDVAADGLRGVQLTPHNSEASITLGKGVASAEPGSMRRCFMSLLDDGYQEVQAS